VLAAYAALALYQLGTPDLDGDEGRYGISAVNILRDYHQFAIVSPDPDGAPWSTWPFAYPTLIAGSILLLGKTEFAIRVVNVVLLLLTAGCLYRVAWSLLKERTTALLAFALFLLNPATMAYARSAMAEPSILLWGCAGLMAASLYHETGRTWYAILAGVALALGFLSKLWLILPFCAACAVLVLARAALGKWGKPIGDMLLGLAVFVVVSASHLVLLRLIAPESLKTWLATYFVGAAATRIAGAGYDPRMWYKPGWFYYGMLFKAQLVTLPFLFAGTVEAVRRRQWLLLGCLAWLVAPVVVLSFFKVKEAPYICQAYPALALLTAVGVAAFLKGVRSRVLLLSTVAAIAVAVYFFAVGAINQVQALFTLPLYVVYLVAAPAGWPLAKWRVWAAVAAGAFSLLFADSVVVLRQLQHRTHYREIAAYFSQRVGPLHAGKVIFTSPEYPAIGFYLFRQGEYWDSYYVHNSDELFRYDLQSGNHVFYVVDLSRGGLYGGRLKPEWDGLLLRYTRDVTPQIEQASGEKLRLRVLVPLAENQDKPAE